jgi:hypothetical protein
MTDYNFTIKLHPWGDLPNAGIVEIDPDALYGYFERKDGSEGGGLWFDKATAHGHLNLVDFDGMYVLPMKVITALRAAGVVVDADFE